jgi:hypothetical protein
MTDEAAHDPVESNKLPNAISNAAISSISDLDLSAVSPVEMTGRLGGKVHGSIAH